MPRATPRLYAPTIDRIELLIDGRDEPLEMEAEGGGWWRPPADFDHQGELRYRFRLRSKSWFCQDETVEVLDPEARELSDDTAWSLDREDLHRYPDFEHDGHQLPDPEQHVIYEVFPRDIEIGNGETGLRRVRERLPYLRDLGITAIQLMPIERGPGAGWGYTPIHCFAIDPHYGTRQDLAQLVADAHQTGMAVILDGIYNHAHQDIPLASIDHDLWFHHQPKDPDTAWGPQFDYQQRLGDDGPCPAREFAFRRLDHWLRGFHVDGIRFDAANQIADWDALRALRHEVHHLAGPKPVIAIAEQLPEDPAIVGQDGAMDRCWRESFGDRLRACMVGEWNGDDLEGAIDPRRDGYPPGNAVINYLSSHDLGHTLPHLREAGLGDDTALRRMELGYTVLLTAMGIPMIFMGDELGGDLPDEDEGSHPIPWHLLDEDRRRQDLHARIRRLIHLRHEHGALRSGTCEFVQRDDQRRLLAWHRWDEHGDRILVALNASDEEASVALTPPAPGRWQEVTLGYDLQAAEDAALEIRLEPWQAQVLVYQG